MSSRPKVLGMAILLLASTLGVRAAAATYGCFGSPATVVGTTGDDVIRGTGGSDVIVSRGGDDTVLGRGGEDFICGGAGSDKLFGGLGGEFLFGGGGDDRLQGDNGPFSDYAPGPGDDRVVGSDVVDDIVHFQGADRPVVASLISGKATGQGTDELVSVEHLLGGSFDDTLIGNGRDNTLVGRRGADTLRGGEGFDFIAGQQGDDDIHGGTEFDIADYYEENNNAGFSTAGPISVDLPAGTAEGDGSDTLDGIEGATGSTGDDTMIGDDQDNAFFLLLEGADTVALGAGADFVDAGRGADDLSGESGNDLLAMFDGKSGQPRVNGVTVDLSANTTSDGDSISSFESAFTTPADDELTGDGGSNQLFAFDGDDTVTAGDGDDLVDPGNGVDDADGGAGGDLLGNLDHYTGGITIDLSDNSDSDGDTLAGFEDLIGTFVDDTLTGDDGANTVFGSAGPDVVSGLGGDDLLSGDGGFDQADGGLGADRCGAEDARNCEFVWPARPMPSPAGVYTWRATLKRLGVSFRPPA
jgi:Ca2+-binding RTX toxin-like protein